MVVANEPQHGPSLSMAAVEHAAKLIAATQERIRLINQQRRPRQFDRPEDRRRSRVRRRQGAWDKAAQNVEKRGLAAALLSGRDDKPRADREGVQGVSMERPQRDVFSRAVFHHDVSANR